MARLTYLSREDVEVVIQRLAARLFKGYPDPLPAFTLLGGEAHGGGLLESAIALPRQPYYKTIYDKAAVLFRSIIKNHPFVDGNKRAAVAVVTVFLLVNLRLLVASHDELVRLALDIARSERNIDWHEISRWMKERTVSVRAPTGDTLAQIMDINPVFDEKALIDRLFMMYEAMFLPW